MGVPISMVSARPVPQHHVVVAVDPGGVGRPARTLLSKLTGSWSSVVELADGSDLHARGVASRREDHSLGGAKRVAVGVREPAGIHAEPELAGALNIDAQNPLEWHGLAWRAAILPWTPLKLRTTMLVRIVPTRTTNHHLDHSETALRLCMPRFPDAGGRYRRVRKAGSGRHRARRPVPCRIANPMSMRVSRRIERSERVDGPPCGKNLPTPSRAVLSHL